MEDKELRAIYAEACGVKGYEPDSSQYRLWREMLLWCDPRDLRDGLKRWWETETQLPMPSQLKPMVDVAQRSRIARASQRLDLVVWKCPVCGVTRSGWPNVGDYTRRFCMAWKPKGGRCAAIMQEFLREPAEAGAA